MKISIAMATYNGAKYLQEQLDSFVAQTRQPDELVVCDDVSSDTTVDILESFRQQAPFAVRIYRNETNLGFVKNFEKALSLCTGDIIFLSDQDDVWFDEKICTVEQIFVEKPNKIVIINDQVITSENLNASKFTKLGNITSAGLKKDYFMTGCCTSMRREWLELVLPMPGCMDGHDLWINRLALALDVRLIYELPLQYYRRHGDNASNWLVSKPVKITQLSIFRQHGFRDATAGWRQELERMKASWLRISESTEALKKLGLIDRQTTAIETFSRRVENLNHRIEMMALSRFKRLPRVLGMWSRGGYSDFAGWKSAIKDIFRP